MVRNIAGAYWLRRRSPVGIPFMDVSSERELLYMLSLSSNDIEKVSLTL